MNKKSLSIFLAILMVLSLIPVFSASAATVIETGECGVDATYELYDNGHLIISGTGAINPNAFEYNESIKKLTVEQGITDTGSGAFDYCTNIKEIELPDSIKIISPDSFYGCSSLEEINIPENTEMISADAFMNCTSLKKIRLPEKVNIVDKGAFQGCNSLQYITILNPACDICDFDYTINGQAKIYGYADSTAESYANTWSRTFIAIEKNKVYPVAVPEKTVSELFHGNIAHYECAVTGKVFSDSEGKNEITKESVIIHNEIAVPAKAATCIEKGHTEGTACSICGKLITAVPIEINPDAHNPAEPIYVPVTESTCTVKGHGDKIIYCKDCGKEISREINTELPLAPHNISEWIIDKEEGIRQGICTVCGETVTDAIPAYKEKGQCGDNAYYVLYPDGHLIISGTGTIWDNFFSFNEFIKKLTVKQGITDTGGTTFKSCSKIKEIDLPDSIKNISIYSFIGTSPESIKIPENTEKISKSAFLGCLFLKKIRLPEKVNSIGEFAFCDCTSLQYITILNPACDIHDKADTIPEQAKIYGYADSTAESYATKYNRTFIPIEENKVYPIAVPEKTVSELFHGNIAHYECAVTGKVFSDSEGKNEITKESVILHNEISVPAKAATCIKKGHTEGTACSVCGKFITAVPTEINPEVHTPAEPIYVPVTESTCTVKGQGDKYIYCKDCGKELSREINIELPLAPHAVSEWTVDKEETDTEEGLKHGVCTVCGETVTEAIPTYKQKGQCGDNASYKLYHDGHLIISGTGPIMNYAFYGNNSIKKLTVEQGITDTGYCSFCNCKKLTEVKLPESIKIFNCSSFADCYHLKSINIPDNTETISAGAFSSCSSLTEIRLLEKLNRIENIAFQNCLNLQYITILNPACNIWDHENTIPGQTKIYGYAGSTAESYAKNYNRTFIPIEENKFYPVEVPAAETTEEKHGNIKYYECAVTGKLFSDIECTNEITIEDTIAHNTKYIMPEKAATCTENGLTEGRRCSLCGEISVPQKVIPALGHTIGEWTVTVPAACTEAGSEKGVCSVCGEEVTREIPAAGHTEEIIPAVAPTCTETGLTEGVKCSVCGEIIVAQTAVDALGHTVGEWTVTVPAACTEAGSEKGVCTVCGEEVTREIPATGHTEEILPAVAPTCTETGLTDGKKCSVCGEIIVAQTVIEAAGHTEEILPAVPATCTNTGLTEGKKCSVCGEILVPQTVIEAAGHTEEILPAVAPTCTKTGLTEGKKCSVCGEILVPQTVIEAAGHTEEILPAVAPTCTKTGLTEGKKCSVCGEILVPQTVIEATGHTEEILPAVAPTCTETGLTEGKKCSVCGEILTAQTVLPATGHTEEILPAVAPTCTQTGLTEGKKCSVCGEIIVAQTAVEALGHTFGEWTVDVPATCTEAGSEKRVCSVCGEEETRVIAAAGHKDADEDGKCDVCGEDMEEEVVEIWFPFKKYIVAFFEKVLQFFFDLFLSMGIEC